MKWWFWPKFWPKKPKILTKIDHFDWFFDRKQLVERTLVERTVVEISLWPIGHNLWSKFWPKNRPNNILTDFLAPEIGQKKFLIEIVTDLFGQNLVFWPNFGRLIRSKISILTKFWPINLLENLEKTLPNIDWWY